MQDSRSEARRVAASGIVPTEADRVAARRLIDDLGEYGAAEKAGVSCQTVHKIAAGSAVRNANLIALRLAAGLLKVAPWRAMSARRRCPQAQLCSS